MKLKFRPSAKKTGSKSPTTATRKALSAKGQAMPDNSFPVPNLDFLKRAIRSLGRTDPAKRPAVVAFLRKRAKALGATALLKKGALAMSGKQLKDNVLLMHGILESCDLIELTQEVNESLELAGVGAQASSPAQMGGATAKAKGKLGLKSDMGVALYAKLRKKGLPHGPALAAAKKKESGMTADEMSNASPKA